MNHHNKQSIVAVEKSFEEMLKANLLDETFTKEEVTNFINNLENIVKNEIDCELTAFTNTNILMMHQFFQQAEKWHLRLNVDISEMQNKDLLLEVEKYKSQYNVINQLATKKKLIPIRDQISNDFADMLHKRLEQLESDNCKLLNDLKYLKDSFDEVDKERKALRLLVEEKNKNINANNYTQLKDIEVQTQEILNIEENDHEKCKIALNKLESELKITQSQLKLANLELERKFNDTVAYINMKDIITKKNEQVRELRDKLQVYEKEDNNESV
ncbi:leucine zipper transcription factor-like protein 1 isoform X2 [Daktulosphaira vitifoliae]|nr:leucine zipper transcription factor-like protein 1 isoform X2 [Daktulosphaira vitifoliae]XP_050542683.1 leucine zipper transcription factor-like protein 1 isoform X2 [Daktulosphaira vitifoliae]